MATEELHHAERDGYRGPHSAKLDGYKESWKAFMAYPQAIEVYQKLKPGDRLEIVHEVKVGFRVWTTTTRGTVIRTERRRHSLHFNRNFDDKVYSDVIILRRDDGELTTVTLDEFSNLRVLESA